MIITHVLPPWHMGDANVMGRIYKNEGDNYEHHNYNCWHLAFKATKCSGPLPLFHTRYYGLIPESTRYNSEYRMS